jgi:hypothetical protein
MVVRRLWIVLVLTLAMGSFAAAFAQSSGGLPGPDPEDLWQYITRTNPYEKWRPFPGLDQPFLQLTELPHGDWVGVWANDIAVDSMENPLAPFTMKYGSILVKENYPAGPTRPPKSSLVAITVMYKVNGYHVLPGQEEWFWVMYSPQGAVETVATQPWAAKPPFKTFKGEVLAGKPWLCLHCHAGAAQSSKEAVGDYLWKLKPFIPAH